MAQALTQKKFLEAVADYKAGYADRAEMTLRSILDGDPNHAACLHLMGVIKHSLGQPAEAEQLIGKSLVLNPDFPEMHFNYGLVLAAQDKHAEATTSFRRTVDLKPSHAEAHFALGNSLKALSKTEDAIKAYRQGLKVKPNSPAALNSLGVLLCQQGRFLDAANCFEHALSFRAEYPEALNNLGATFCEMGKFSDAVRCCEQAIKLQPDYAAALSNLGNALKAQEKWEEAIECYERALAINPKLAEARNNLGLALLHGRSDLDAAEFHFKEILAEQPDYVPALTHLGITHCHRDAFEEGIAYYDKALTLEPNYRDALNNKTTALRAAGRITEPELIEAYERVVAIEPDNPEGHNNLAMALLLAGHFEEGWREYEWRWKTAQLAAAQRNFSQPQWCSEAAQGRVLLIHAEQGFGDTLQFCRYAPLAGKLGWRVVMEVQPELVGLIKSLPGVEKVVGRGEALPDFDLHSPMMSLPFAFGTKPETIPVDIPYLQADKDKAAAWRERMQPESKDLKIGLVWAGNPRLFSFEMAATNRRRSIDPEFLMPLASITGVRFYSLQKDGPKMPAAFGVIDAMPDCRDFADTAALIANLDLVISVDTAVAHLAAALGKPVWLLNRYDSCWRWFMGREDSPWYPALRLFRQPRPGDWTGVIEKVRDELGKKN